VSKESGGSSPTRSARSTNTTDPTARAPVPQASPTAKSPVRRSPDRPSDDLPPLPPLDENLHGVHYSSALQRDCGDQTPPVSAISVKHPWTGRQVTFSAFTIAEASGIPRAQFLDRLPELERELLRQFYQFVAAHPEAVWVHWGMCRVRFGFEALAQRAQFHGLEPVEIPPDRRFDLSSYLKLLYGDDYVPHERLWNAIRLNLGADPHLLDKDAAAAAWARGDYGALVGSLEAKVGSITSLFDRVRRGTFKVRDAGDVAAPAEGKFGRQAGGGEILSPERAALPSCVRPDPPPKTGRPTDQTPSRVVGVYRLVVEELQPDTQRVLTATETEATPAAGGRGAVPTTPAPPGGTRNVERQSDSPLESVGSQTGPVAGLIEAAERADLAGKEAKVVKIIAERGGRVPIADAALHCRGDALSAFKRAKPKLKRQGWNLFQRDNEFRAERRDLKGRK
jgi:hypothetical protein